jgi:catalase
VAENIGMVREGGKVAGAKEGKAGKKVLSESKALSMDKPAETIKGRKVAVLVADGVDAEQIQMIKSSLGDAGVVVEVIARMAGTVEASDGSEVKADRPAPNAPSVVYDAVLIPGTKESAGALTGVGLAMQFVQEMYAHYKPIGACSTAKDFLAKAIERVGDATAEGIFLGEDGGDFGDLVQQFMEGMKQHRFFRRGVEDVPA